MSTLLVDNYDSYTYNVFHLLAAVSGTEPIVVRNDVVSWTALSRWDFDAIVLSPGPGRPERWHDFGVCADILRFSEIPVLGICLGHQGLGHLLEARVTSAPVVMHGRLSRIHHHGRGLFAGIPQACKVVRYHSLAVAAGELPATGRVTAWTDEGVVMGLEHTRRPIWGVQFHPESVATEHGRRLVENFYALANEHNRSRARRAQRRPPPRSARARGRSAAASALHTRVRSLAGFVPGETLFERLFGAREHAFWLDSATAPSPLARRSFMGTTMGPHGCVIEYDVERKQATFRRDGERTVERGSIFDLLQRELDGSELRATAGFPPGLPGYVGYLGYECKADCGSPNAHRSKLPDAVVMLANRVVAIDHEHERTHLLALCHGEDDAEAERWLQRAEALVRELLAGERSGRGPGASAEPAAEPEAGPVVFRCGRGRNQYLADIARCQAALAAGESYEICLTDQIHCDASVDPLALYRELRRSNPAPFAAYLRLGELAVLSSSPERFLSVDRDRRVEARPIKGTAPRSRDAARDAAHRAQLLGDEKTFAEHLMIVDLLRNDLGRVCEIDTVRVPRFMAVEPYATVHQLISSVTGVLERERSPLECVRACFPGGSMTGAPKLRTMGIIDDIEREARGVYSGALGYFGFDGSVDLSIVIRTIVMRPGTTTIGAGGAIVMQSDAEEEFDELLLKARAPMRALARTLSGSDDADAWTIELEPASVAAPARARAAA